MPDQVTLGSQLLTELFALCASPVIEIPDLLDSLLEAALRLTAADVGGAVFVPDSESGMLFWSFKLIEGAPTHPLRSLIAEWEQGRREIPAQRVEGLLPEEVETAHEYLPALFQEGRSRISLPLREHEPMAGRLQLEAADREAFNDGVPEELSALVRRAELLVRRLMLRQHAAARGQDIHLVGSSRALLEMEERIRRLAVDPKSPVLIRGERGSGKELAAYAVHYSSSRRNGPFVPANSAAFISSLASDALFGHARGAFTGADEARSGLFQQAHGGSLFLDEIGDLPLDVQGSLLRALDRGEIRKIGSDRPVLADVRILAATNKDLEASVQEGTFRGDLFDRLNVLQVRVPPLRERKEDIPLLTDFFLRKACLDNGRFQRMEQLHTCHACLRAGGRSCAHSELYEALEQQAFPGNIRELRNQVLRLATLAGNDVLHPKHLDLPASPKPGGPGANGHGTQVSGAKVRSFADEKADLRLDTVITRHIQSVLELTEGNKTHAAKLLGLPLTTLINKMKRLGIR